MTIEAKVIADSVAPSGVRLTTLQLRYPRFIHSEFMTHRLFSRNASSSRAIPVKKIIEEVSDPAIPIHWGKNQPGMQAREEVDDVTFWLAHEEWMSAAALAVRQARKLEKLQIHKQIVNRILEPFQHISVVVTATEWDNFFKLRLHPDAQPEICELARVMKEAMDKHTPLLLQPGEWHTPYGLPEQSVKTSVAGCARVSYLNHDQTLRDWGKDLTLHDQLFEAGHYSPFEHQATPMDDLHPIEGHPYWSEGITHLGKDGCYWSGNFRGWIQYRQLIT